MKNLIFALLLLIPAGCFQAAGQPFPTSAQILTACKAETASGTPSSQAPDCVAHYAIQMACNAEALGPAINPVVSVVNPVVGSVLQIQATLNKALCTQKGFYEPLPSS